MNVQWLVTLILIGLAGIYLLHRGWRVWRSLKGSGCGGGCGCSKTVTKGPVLLPSDQLTLRQRPDRSG